MITLEELKRDKEALEEKFRLYEEQQKKLVKEKYELELPNWDKYYYRTSIGEIIIDYNQKDNIDEVRFEIGNFFKTEEEAELEVKRRKLMTRFNHFRDKCNGDWEPDFKKTGEKYYICNEENSFLHIGWRIYNNNYPNFGYFKKYEDCEKAIELFGAEIKELF